MKIINLHFYNNKRRFLLELNGFISIAVIKLQVRIQIREIQLWHLPIKPIVHLHKLL
jgi:hypothetical protein